MSDHVTSAKASDIRVCRRRRLIGASALGGAKMLKKELKV